MGAVRATAVAVIPHPLTGALLVDEIVEPGAGRTFHRLPGGGIDFQELAHDTVARELKEEYRLSDCPRRLLTTLPLTKLHITDATPDHAAVSARIRR